MAAAVWLAASEGPAGGEERRPLPPVESRAADSFPRERIFSERPQLSLILERQFTVEPDRAPYNYISACLYDQEDGLLASSWDGSVHLWDCRTGALRDRLSMGPSTQIHQMVWARFPSEILIQWGGGLEIVKVQPGSLRRSFWWKAGFDWPTSFAVVPDGTRLVMHSQNELRMVELSTLRTIWTVELPEKYPLFMKIVDEAEGLLFGGFESGLTRRSMKDGRELRSLPFSPAIRVGWSAAVCRSRSSLFASGPQGPVTEISLETGTTLNRKQCHDRFHTALLLHEPSGTLFSAGDQGVLAYGVDGLKPLATVPQKQVLEGKSVYATSLAISPNGARLAVGLDTGKVLQFRLERAAR